MAGRSLFFEVQRLAPSLWPGRVGDVDGRAIAFPSSSLSSFFLGKFEGWRVPCSLVALRM